MLLYLFWSLLCSHSSSGIFKSSWLHCRWSTSVLAWADVGISTAAERNIKNVQPLSGRSIGKMLAEHSVFFFFWVRLVLSLFFLCRPMSFGCYCALGEDVRGRVVHKSKNHKDKKFHWVNPLIKMISSVLYFTFSLSKPRISFLPISLSSPRLTVPTSGKTCSVFLFLLCIFLLIWVSCHLLCCPLWQY